METTEIRLDTGNPAGIQSGAFRSVVATKFSQNAMSVVVGSLKLMIDCYH
jgi:hypothetical protein